ncbi:MAG: hypothetical protein KF900_08970 [Bacteroidetes bacterium]|nr:hypothetical protein [Bacteroidota bacterium]
MNLKFNINRPKVGDDEIKKREDFDTLVKQFKEQSLKKAQGDESWWKDKKIRYTAVIAGVTVICTITYNSIINNQKQQTAKHETITTSQTHSTQNKNTAFVKAPSSALKTNYTAYKVNNAKGGSVTHTTSSKIKIPKNSFVDKNGKDIIGDVTIEYKEFHDMGDIIANGIPMAYDSAGTKYNLETAGMFDIRGYQNGEPVFIKPDKNIEVELASQTAEDRFNQYYLDTVKRNWQYIKIDDIHTLVSEKKSETKNAESPKLNEIKKQIDLVIPKKIDSVKVVYTTRTSQLQKPKEPAKPEKVTGKPTIGFEADNKDFPELQAFKNVIFEVGTENKNYSNEFHDITWSNVKMSEGTQKGKNYLLTLIYRNRVEKLIVYPVLSGADFDKAQKTYEEKLANYQSLLEKRNAEEKRLMAEMQAKQAAYMAELKKKEEEYKAERAKLLAQQQNEVANNFNTINNQTRATRIFQVSQFGIYNSDCPHKAPQGNSVNPIFVYEEKFLIPDFIYLIDHTQKSVYALDKNDGIKFAYNPANEYSICLFQKNNLYLCSKISFKQSADAESNKFKIVSLPDKADNLIDFKKALEI